MHLLRGHGKLDCHAFRLDRRSVLLGRRRHLSALARQRSLESLREGRNEKEREREKKKTGQTLSSASSSAILPLQPRDQLRNRQTTFTHAFFVAKN